MIDGRLARALGALGNPTFVANGETLTAYVAEPELIGAIALGETDEEFSGVVSGAALATVRVSSKVKITARGWQEIRKGERAPPIKYGESQVDPLWDVDKLIYDVLFTPGAAQAVSMSSERMASVLALVAMLDADFAISATSKGVLIAGEKVQMVLDTLPSDR